MNRDYQNNMKTNNEHDNHIEYFNGNNVNNINNINNINKKEMVGGINYMYPQTKTGYDHYYDINQHMILEYPNKDLEQNDQKNDEVSDNKMKNLVEEITNNIDNMENIYENYESNDNKKNEDNSNKKNKKKNKKNDKEDEYLCFGRIRDSIIIFIIYIILSIPSIQTFIGKYIKQINPNPETCSVPMTGVIIYGIILSTIYYLIKYKLLTKHFLY